MKEERYKNAILLILSFLLVAEMFYSFGEYQAKEKKKKRRWFKRRNK